MLLIIWSAVSPYKAHAHIKNPSEAVVSCYCEHLWPFMGVQLSLLVRAYMHTHTRMHSHSHTAPRPVQTHMNIE